MQVDDICAGLRACLSPEAKDDARCRYLPELSFIGLVAYYEGFVRYHFASCINICPKLLNNLSVKRPDHVLSLKDISAMDTLHGTIGFLLADGLQFSSPNDINSNYNDLLKVTPFTKKDCSKYDKILHDRNQIVHSAGMYTTKYLRAHKMSPPPIPSRLYMDSIVISAERALEVAEYLLGMSEKLVTATYNRLMDPACWHSDEEMRAFKKHAYYFVWNTEAFRPSIK